MLLSWLPFSSIALDYPRSGKEEFWITNFYLADYLELTPDVNPDYGLTWLYLCLSSSNPFERSYIWATSSIPFEGFLFCFFKSSLCLRFCSLYSFVSTYYDSPTLKSEPLEPRLNSSSSSLTTLAFYAFLLIFLLLYWVFAVKSSVSSRVAYPTSIFDSFYPFKSGTDLLTCLLRPFLAYLALLSILNVLTYFISSSMPTSCLTVIFLVSMSLR